MAERGAAENNVQSNSAQLSSDTNVQRLLGAVFKPPESYDAILFQDRLSYRISMVTEIAKKLNQGLKNNDPGSFQHNAESRLRPELANALLELYKILGVRRVSGNGSPNLFRMQSQLVHSSLVGEERQFNLFPKLAHITEGSQGNISRNEGGNRFFSQVSFLSFLDSIDGTAIMESLESEMTPQERAFFSKSIKYLLESLAPGYLDLLSKIEAEKFLSNKDTTGKTTSKEYFANLENAFRDNLTRTLTANESFLLPLGWSLPDAGVGHHLFLWGDKSGAANGTANIRFIDTTDIEEDDALPKVQNRNEGVGQTLADVTMAVEELKPYALSPKKCSIGFSNVELAKVITRTARLALLQLPGFTNLNMAPDEKANAKNISMFFLKLNYSLGTNEQQLIENESPLSRWKWRHSPSCTLAPFQPLLQEIARKFLSEEGINDPNLEKRLKGYFELLMQSFKVFLVNKLLDESSIELTFQERCISRAYKEALYYNALETIWEGNLQIESNAVDMRAFHAFS